MNKTYEPPDFLKILNLLLPLMLSWQGRTYTINDWREKILREVKENRKQTKIKTFNRFVSALLEGFRTKGKDYELRIELMNRYFHDFSDVTEENIQQILIVHKYSLKTRGLEIILNARRIAEPSPFQWEQYFCEAERRYESGYVTDNFFEINGVGKKVRDFALSEFSTFYCAIDRHIADVIRRTGLLLYGYGQPDFGTSPTENYNFLQRLIVKFSKETGWAPDSSQGYSPKEIDTMLWFFSQEGGICKARPGCSRCPIKDLCLTFQNM